MATRITSIGVGKLTSTASYVDAFLVEIYSDSGFTTKVGSQTALAVRSGTSWVQKNLILFNGLIFGNTYWLKAFTVAPVSGQLSTAVTFNLVAGAATTPAPTYGIVSQTANFAGINYVVSVASVPADIEHYEWTYTTDGSTPASTVKPKSIVVPDPTSGNLVIFAGAVPGVNVNLFIRAINTSQLVQAWTAPFTVMQALSNVLDNVGDGTSFTRTTPNQVTGAGRAFTNINADNTYATIPYHGSAFRRVTTTNEGGTLLAAAGTAVGPNVVGSFVLQIPAGFTSYKGTLTVNKTAGTGVGWIISAIIKIGALSSGTVSITQPTASGNAVVSITGLTGGTQITVQVVLSIDNTSDATHSVTGQAVFTHNEYTDQDTSNLL